MQGRGRGTCSHRWAWPKDGSGMGEGGNTTGSSACTTVAMKHPGAVSEFGVALLDLSHRTHKASVATCTCYLLVTTALSRCLQR